MEDLHLEARLRDGELNVEINYPPSGGHGLDEEYDSHYLDDVSVTLPSC